MPLAAGTRLAAYEVIAAIGAGGMGEVYRARDTRLDRDVAIKVLPRAAAADPESRARFEREARTISQLNHPHICALYDVGRARPIGGAAAGDDEVDFLVMEYLDGESMAARLERGPIGPDQALEYAMQIADALDKAHRRGIVHRDLKPANVMLVRSGVARTTTGTNRMGATIAKLLDFGLAKLAPPSSLRTAETMLAEGATGAARDIRNSPATAAGTILGTFQYMAPEQVEGGEIDARADIWGFGCVLYEMLTGRRAFDGQTQASVIANILNRDPAPVTELQPLTPPALGRVVRICFAKDPDARFQSAYDLLLQLQWIAEGGSAAGLPAPTVERRKRRERLLWAAAAVVTLGLGAAGAWVMKPATAAANVVGRFGVALPDGQDFSRTGRRFVSISPDGRRIAYIANQRIYVREMDELEARAVDGTNEDPLDLTFSPDGQSLAYFVPNGQPPAFILKKIQIRGGTPVPLCPTEWPYGASWQGDTILFAQGSTSPGILSVPAAGGAPTMLVQVSSGEYVSQPHFVGDGRLLLFTFRASVSVPWSDAEIVVQAPGEASRTVLIRGGTDARPIGVDRLVYYRNGTVFAVSFDVRDRTTRGGAVPVIEGVQAALATGAGIFSVAERTGTLVFLPGDDGSNSPRQLVWIDRMGKEQPIPAPVRNYSQPRLSPEGTRIAVVVHNGQSSGLAIWDLSRDILSALTPADGRDRMPLWSPDGRSVIYRSIDADGQGRLMRIDASGAGAPELLLELGSMSVLSADGYPESISHDGRLLFIRRIRPTPDIFVLALDGDRTPRPLIATPMMEMHGQISPDGRWLAYTFSDASGPGTVFLRPYPDVSGGRWQLAPNRASDPVWARSSRELFFIDIDQNLLMSVTVQPGPVFGRAVEVLDNQPYLPAAGSGTDYDLSPDGQRFLMIKPETAVTGGAADRSALVVVTHWVDALRAQLK